MKKGGGKAKGASFERDCCKRLSLWMTGGQHDDLFWRSAMSGGRASVQFKHGKTNRTQAGDITAIHPLGEKLLAKVFVECKFHRNLNFLGLLQSKKPAGNSAAAFWNKCCEQAEQYARSPMLIARQNNMPTLVGLSKFGVRLLKIGHYVIAFFPNRGDVAKDLYLVPFEDFLAHANPPNK